MKNALVVFLRFYWRWYFSHFSSCLTVFLFLCPYFHYFLCSSFFFILSNLTRSFISIPAILSASEILEFIILLATLLHGLPIPLHFFRLFVSFELLFHLCPFVQCHDIFHVAFVNVIY